jgi:hypothetical protein
MRVAGVELKVALSGLAPAAAAKPLAFYRTTRTEDARLVEGKGTETGIVRVPVPEGSILTLTNLRSPTR